MIEQAKIVLSEKVLATKGQRFFCSSQLSLTIGSIDQILNTVAHEMCHRTVLIRVETKDTLKQHLSGVLGDQ